MPVAAIIGILFISQRRKIK
ncbi:hypothetical protein [Methanosarcina sp. KYL-1]